MQEEDKYIFSFTAGALLYTETKEYISNIVDFDSYLKKKEQVDYMVIPTNSESSKKKIKSVIDTRMMTLNASYLNAFREMDELDQRIILFLAICKTYRIITEFCLEVVYQKWKMFDNTLNKYDFQYFLSSKLSSEQFDNLTDKTKHKVAQVVLRIFKDVKLLQDDKITQPYLSDALRRLIEDNGDSWFYHCILHPNA